jgi:hypothetical protein
VKGKPILSPDHEIFWFLGSAISSLVSHLCNIWEYLHLLPVTQRSLCAIVPRLLFKLNCPFCHLEQLKSPSLLQLSLSIQPFSSQSHYFLWNSYYKPANLVFKGLPQLYHKVSVFSLALLLLSSMEGFVQLRNIVIIHQTLFKLCSSIFTFLILGHPSCPIL